MFIEQPPQFIRQLFPCACWRMSVSERSVYLTFDDGPIPKVTPWVLGVLDKYNVKANKQIIFNEICFGNSNP